MGLLFAKSSRARRCEFASSRFRSKSSKLVFIFLLSKLFVFLDLSVYLSLDRWRVVRPLEPPGVLIPELLLEPRDRRGGRGAASSVMAAMPGSVMPRGEPLGGAWGSRLNLRRRSPSEPEDMLVLPVLLASGWTAGRSRRARAIFRWYLSMALYNSPEGLTVAVDGLSSRMARTMSLALRYRRSGGERCWERFPD